MVEKITRDVLESQLACRYKCHLKLAGKQGSKSNYESWLIELRAREKRDSIVNFLAHHRASKIIRDTALDVSILKTGPEVILDGTFENELVSLRFDGLIKVQGLSELGQFHVTSAKRLLGTSKNRSYSSDATKFSANDSASRSNS
jgi:hypothetical protein